MKAGFSDIIITPETGKIPIAGSLNVRYTDEVYLDLYATTLYIESEGIKAVFVSLDICHPTAELTDDVFNEVKSIIPDLKKEEFILFATHATPYCSLSKNEPLYTGVGENESDGLPMKKMRHYIAEKVKESVKNAFDNCCECYFELSVGEILTGYCRRIVYNNGKAVMYGNPFRDDFLRQEYPDGGSSKYLYFYSKEDGKLLGIFAISPCPAQADESSSHITGDFWAVARNRLCEHYKEKIKLLTACSAAGELSPHRVIKSEGKSTIEESGTDSAERLGKLVGDNIIYCKDKPIKRYITDTTVSLISQYIDFPKRKPTKEQYNKSFEYFAGDMDNIRIDDKVLFTYVKKYKESGQDTYKAQVFGIKIGDILFFTAPAELFCEYSKRIMMHFPDNPVISIQLANDYIGYMPTKEAVDAGGYSTDIFSALTTPDGGEMYINRVTDLLNKLLEE